MRCSKTMGVKASYLKMGVMMWRSWTKKRRTVRRISPKVMKRGQKKKVAI